MLAKATELYIYKHTICYIGLAYYMKLYVFFFFLSFFHTMVYKSLCFGSSQHHADTMFSWLDMFSYKHSKAYHIKNLGSSLLTPLVLLCHSIEYINNLRKFTANQSFGFISLQFSNNLFRKILGHSSSIAITHSPDLIVWDNSNMVLGLLAFSNFFEILCTSLRALLGFTKPRETPNKVLSLLRCSI